MYFQLNNFSVMPLFALTRNRIQSNVCALRIQERNCSWTMDTCHFITWNFPDCNS